MKDPELTILIDELETRADMPVADFAGVIHALNYLLPENARTNTAVDRISTTDGALLVADHAYPDWSVNIHGRANDRDGHWSCSLRENDSRDEDAVIGKGRSPVLAQAILAAVLRVALELKKDDAPG